jgi:hypothetical protein
LITIPHAAQVCLDIRATRPGNPPELGNAALADSIGEPANLLGHSYGAICALEGATLTPHHHHAR